MTADFTTPHKTNPSAACCCTYVGRGERQTQQSVHQEGENSGDGRDDAGDAGVDVLDVADRPYLLLFLFS